MRWITIITITVLIIISSVFGQVVLKVSLDKTEYSLGDLVRVEINGPPRAVIGVEIRDPNNNIFLLKQLELDGKGRAILEFKLGENAALGNYTIHVATPGGFNKTWFIVRGGSSMEGLHNVVFYFKNYVEGLVVEVDGVNYGVKERVLKLKLGSGPHLVRVFYDGCLVSSKSIDVEGDSEHAIEVYLYKVRVLFRDFLGNPVEGIEVELIGDCMEFKGVTGANGVVVFENVPIGNYRIVYEGGEDMLKVDRELELKYTLKPPLWVYGVALLAIASIVYIILKKALKRGYV